MTAPAPRPQPAPANDPFLELPDGRSVPLWLRLPLVHQGRPDLPPVRPGQPPEAGVIPTGASVRPLPVRKGPRGVRQVEVSPGRWMDEAVAIAQGIPLTFPLHTMGAGPVTRRHEAPEVPPMPSPAPAAPAKGPGRPPSPAQEQAYRAVTERGLFWADVAREMGTTAWSVKNMIAAYMRRNGIPGEPPGRTPKDETTRRTLLAKAQTPKAATQVPPAAEVAPVADRLVLAPEGHPWAADPEPIDLGGELDSEHASYEAPGHKMTPSPTADHAETIPVAEPPAASLHEDPSSSDHAPTPDGQLDAAAAVARLARERDEMEMARDELREMLVDAADAVVASDPRTRYVESLLAAAPAEYIRDRIERALGIEADRDAWADGYRRALRDVLDVVRGTRGTTYPQQDIIERVARLAIDVPAA